MLFRRLKSEGLTHYSYIIGDGGEAVVIDPRLDCDAYVEIASREGCRVSHILETHRNEDYLVGSVGLSRLTGAAIWHADAQLDYRYGKPVEDGQQWQAGGLSLTAILTPGHTPGSFSYLLREPGGAPWMLFSGDTLFAGDAGRVDLMGPGSLEGSARSLYRSIFERLLPLGDGVLLFPAHGSGSVCGGNIADREWTTVGIERQLSPLLGAGSEDEFVQVHARMQARPPYFRQMEGMNISGEEAPVEMPPPLVPDEFERMAKEALIVDTRTELEFNAAHMPGSLSIWEAGLSSYGGWFLPYDRPLLLVMDGYPQVSPTVKQLLRMGYHRLAGYLGGGMMAWHRSGRESGFVDMVTVNELCRRLDGGEEAGILDVRGAGEIAAAGSISGAVEIDLRELPERMDEVPRTDRLYIFCGSGVRSTVAASLLLRQGMGNPVVVLGGFAGWSSTSCPVERGTGDGP